MKGNMKKFIIVLISVAVVLIIGITALTNDKEENQRAEIDESVVLEDAKSFIMSTVSVEEHTTWTKDTVISETIKTYDLNGNVNAYILNLKTDENEAGYFLIEAFDGVNTRIVEFGYDGQFTIFDNKTNKNISEIIGENKIIYIGNRGFLTEENGEYFKLVDGQKVDATKKELEKSYKKAIEN